MVFMSYQRVTSNGVIASSQATAPRTLHLVDLENLCGGPSFSELQARAVEQCYRRAVELGPRDQVVLATSHWAARAAWFGWSKVARRVTRSGPDGADLALLAVIDAETVCDRFERVVIGSGDKIFAQAAPALQAAGVEVMVVSRPINLTRPQARRARDPSSRDRYGAGVCSGAASSVMAPASNATVTVSQVAELAGVGTSAVSNWRKRFSDFPSPTKSPLTAAISSRWIPS